MTNLTRLAVLRANLPFDMSWTVSQRPGSHFPISATSSPFYGAGDAASRSPFKVKHTHATTMQMKVRINAAPGDSRCRLTVALTAARFPGTEKCTDWSQTGKDVLGKETEALSQGWRKGPTCGCFGCKWALALLLPVWGHCVDPSVFVQTALASAPHQPASSTRTRPCTHASTTWTG